MPLILENASTSRLPEVLAWLEDEERTTGDGFFCNRNVITKGFVGGFGVCAILDGASIGFSIFQMYDNGGEIHIIEIRPSHRGQGFAGQILEATIDRLQAIGANYVDVECTSRAGENLCRRHCFEDYCDENNHQTEWGNPMLRRYFSNLRPPARSPWN